MRQVFSIILLLFSAIVFGQSYPSIAQSKKLFIQKSSTSSQKSGFDEFVVDFDQENENLVGTANYERAFWQISPNAEINFAVFQADSFPKLASNDAYPISYITGIRLDSLDLLVAHKNLSGLENKIILEFAHTDASWYPTSNVFHADTFSFTGPIFASNSLDTAYTLRLRPDVWYTGGVPVAIRIHFLSPANDTLLLGAGYPIDGSCGVNNKVGLSPFYPNSFAWYNSYNDLLPTSIGGDIFQDCDGLPGKDSIADGFNPIQNWSATMHLSVGTLSLNNLSSQSNFKVYPNPSSGTIQIISSAELNDWTLIDVSGHPVLHGNQSSFDMSFLPSGIYFLKVKNLHTFETIKICKQ